MDQTHPNTQPNPTPNIPGSQTPTVTPTQPVQTTTAPTTQSPTVQPAQAAPTPTAPLPQKQTPLQPNQLDEPVTPDGDQNTKAALAYLLGLLSGLFFFFTEEHNSFIRFHALQAMSFAVVTGIVSVITLGFLSFLIWPAYLLISAVAMYKAYQGEWFALPVIGDFAKKNSAPKQNPLA